jgi:hypothetical protein
VKALLPVLLLLAAPTASAAQGWECFYRYEKEAASAAVRMPLHEPGRPVLRRPYLSMGIRRFSYEWKPFPRLLEEPFRDPAALGFPLRTQRDPVRGTVILTAPGQRPIRIPILGGSLLGSHVYHGPYLRLKDRRAVASMLSVPRWSATVKDRRGRILEVVPVASPAREELRALYEAARARMIEATRDPAHSPLCDIDRTSETI